MAVSTLDYALMAGNAYFSTRGDQNKIPFPDGWVLLDGYNRRVGTDGFEAAAFQKGSDIVISFAGTDPDSWADKLTDAALAFGYMASQLKQAAQYYMQIKAAHRKRGQIYFLVI